MPTKKKAKANNPCMGKQKCDGNRWRWAQERPREKPSVEYV